MFVSMKFEYYTFTDEHMKADTYSDLLVETPMKFLSHTHLMLCYIAINVVCLNRQFGTGFVLMDQLDELQGRQISLHWISSCGFISKM